MKDIETAYIQDLGMISRPFSSQLRARRWNDFIREYYRDRIAKISALLYPVIGVDVSYWQGNINWDVLSSKIYFVFIRAGRGNGDFDVNFSQYLRGAHDKGRAVGLYWYMIPRTGTNFKQHVAAFASAYKNSGSQLPPVFDVEEDGGMNKTELTGWLQKAINLFKETTDVYPMIYTSAGFWNSHTERTDLPKQLDLWDAHWTTADEPIIPDDWAKIKQPETWDFWQYSSKGDGLLHGASSKFIDLNKYHYSLATFNRQYKMNLSPLEPIPPIPNPTEDKIHPLYFIETTATILNARAGDGAGYSDIGNLIKGTQLPIVDESGDWLKAEFWLHKGYTKKL